MMSCQYPFAILIRLFASLFLFFPFEYTSLAEIPDECRFTSGLRGFFFFFFQVSFSADDSVY